MTKFYYHATPYSNLGSILMDGIEPRNVEHCVYLCESKHDALKFLVLRGCADILVCKCKLNENDVIETFDHSKDFFNCRCFGYDKTIRIKDIVDFMRFDLRR